MATHIRYVPNFLRILNLPLSLLPTVAETDIREAGEAATNASHFFALANQLTRSFNSSHRRNYSRAQAVTMSNTVRNILWVKWRFNRQIRFRSPCDFAFSAALLELAADSFREKAEKTRPRVASF
jgi:hypothetical protein